MGERIGLLFPAHCLVCFPTRGGCFDRPIHAEFGKSSPMPSGNRDSQNMRSQARLEDERETSVRDRRAEKGSRMSFDAQCRSFS